MFAAAIDVISSGKRCVSSLQRHGALYGTECLTLRIVVRRDLDDVSADNLQARETLEDLLDFLYSGTRNESAGCGRRRLGSMRTLVVKPPISGLRKDQLQAHNGTRSEALTFPFCTQNVLAFLLRKGCQGK